MKIVEHKINGATIAEIESEEFIIRTEEDGLDLLGKLYYQGFDRIIIYEKNIISDFFNLKNGMAGEVLQKFSNYRVRLVIVGDFSKYTHNSMRDFIFESNRGKQVNFLSNLSEALALLSGKK